MGECACALLCAMRWDLAIARNQSNILRTYAPALYFSLALCLLLADFPHPPPSPPSLARALSDSLTGIGNCSIRHWARVPASCAGEGRGTPRGGHARRGWREGRTDTTK
jgi:hypothetical protein